MSPWLLLHSTHFIYSMSTKTNSSDKNTQLTMKDAQKKVDQWIKKYGVRYFSELTNMALLTEEVGEVARIISRQYGDQSFKNKEGESKLGEELADVLFVLICLANQTGTDLTQAFEKSMEKKTTRDAKRHLDNPKLSTVKKKKHS
jgi:NTP pyrophosphatase (non-canonical NTP hydrolase)